MVLSFGKMLVNFWPHIFNLQCMDSYFIAQVFQPDIPLPTMSLAEFARLEMDEIERNEQRKHQEVHWAAHMV